MAAPFSFLAARHASVPSSQTSLSTDNARSSSTGPTTGLANSLPRKRLYRPAKPLTYELQNHSTVYLEEGSYVGGFTFLNNLLIAGTSISTPDKQHPAWLPPPQVLALASSLIVYPTFTTRAKSLEWQDGPNAAFRYLRNVSKTVDPLSGNLLTSFTFSNVGSRRRAGGYRGADPDSPDRDGGTRFINSRAATDQLLYNISDDFWHVVGWAFNCSVRYKKRWDRWRLWLELILDWLEVEWSERWKLAQEEGSDAEAIMMASLVWQYIASQDPQNRTTRRRILRAILADGTAQSKKEFLEVWKHETKEPRKEEDDPAKDQKALDIENGEFGDYDLDNDEDDMMEDAGTRVSSRPTRRAASGRKTPSNGNSRVSEDSEDDGGASNSEHGADRLGGIDALLLRQRLLALLAQVAQVLPKQFTDLEDLFDLYTEFFRPLSTRVFASLLITSTLPPPIQMILNTNLLLPLVSKNLPNYTVLSPSQGHLEQYFLPNSAATHSFSANAKISLILENIVMNMMDAGQLKATENLKNAMEEGISARDKAYGDARRKKGNAAEEEQAKGILEMSKDRLLGLLEVLEIAAGLPPRPPRSQPTLGPDLSMSSELSSIVSISSDTDDDTESE